MTDSVLQFQLDSLSHPVLQGEYPLFERVSSSITFLGIIFVHYMLNYFRKSINVLKHRYLEFTSFPSYGPFLDLQSPG